MFVLCLCFDYVCLFPFLFQIAAQEVLNIAMKSTASQIRAATAQTRALANQYIYETLVMQSATGQMEYYFSSNCYQ